MEDSGDFVLMSPRDNSEHPLLRLREHHLIRGHAGLAARHSLDIDLHADTALGRHLAGPAGKSRRAHVLNADDMSGLERFQSGLDQEFFRKRIADLDIRPLGLRLLGQLHGRERRPVNTVAPGRGPDIQNGIADARRRRRGDAIELDHSDRHRIDQRISFVAGVEINLAAHGRYPDTVPVSPDTCDHMFEEIPAAGIRERPEAQRVQVGYGRAPHGEDVPEDAADPGRRALVRLDRRGVVVGLHLKDDAVAGIAERNDARVLQRAGLLRFLYSENSLRTGREYL
jgi:hypothetical protein